VLLVQELQHETVQVTVDERKISNTSTISAVGGQQQAIVSSSVADPETDPYPSDPYFLGLLDPDPDPDPSISKNSKKNLDFYCFVTSF
jgi:hypothetical protein